LAGNHAILLGTLSGNVATCRLERHQPEIERLRLVVGLLDNRNCVAGLEPLHRQMVEGRARRALLALLSSTKFAYGQDKFSGEHAAYIDWGARNCSLKSTSKEHGLVDEANAKDHPDDAGEAGGYLLTSGTRISDLLGSERANPSSPDTPAAPSKGTSKKGQGGPKMLGRDLRRPCSSCRSPML
jgi:hypothetical protein